MTDDRDQFEFNFDAPFFDGETYDEERDQERLGAQLKRVLNVMMDGNWRSLYEISAITNDPVQSISARLRDLRKPRFGHHKVERRNLQGGLFEYRLELTPRAQSIEAAETPTPKGPQSITRADSSARANEQSRGASLDQ